MFVRVATMLQTLRERDAAHALERERWERERADLLDRLALAYGKPFVARDEQAISVPTDGGGWQPEESSPYPGPYDPQLGDVFARLGEAGGF